MPRQTHLLLSLLAALALPLSASAQDFDLSGEQSMLARINAMRAAEGLAPLEREAGLDAAARAHCADMAAQRQLTHVSEASGTPADRVRTAGVEAQTIAENVALHRSADEAHQALLGSDAHRANMLGPTHTHVGLAALTTDHGVYVTQVFATLAGAAPEPVEPQIAEEQVVPPTLPAPSIQEQPEAPRVVQPPPASAPPASAPRAPTAPTPQATYVAQEGSHGTVVLERRAGRVSAYWVYGSGRWWYYPMPPGAQPGQQLEVDRSVQGPPPGFPAHPSVGGAAGVQPSRPQVQPYVQPRPYVQPYVQPQPSYPAPRRGGAVITIVPPVGGYYAPPPPYTGAPSRAWRRSQRQWERARRRWIQQQRRARRRAL